MQQFVNDVIIYLQNFVSSCPFVLSIIVAMIVVATESILPMLPLGVFIALNMLLFGNTLGYIISWVATSFGCYLSYKLVRKLFNKKMEKKVKESEKLEKLMKKINKLSFSSFVLITALPFTPAFAINIAASLAKMDLKKFMLGIIISKLFVVYFWGFMGTTFLQSVTDITVIIKLGLMLLIAYILSKIVLKKYKLD